MLSLQQLECLHILRGNHYEWEGKLYIVYVCRYLLVNYGALILKALFEHWPPVNANADEKQSSGVSQVMYSAHTHTQTHTCSHTHTYTQYCILKLNIAQH